MDFRNKKVTVVGLGTSGFECALLLEKEGAIISVTDTGNTEEIRKNASVLREKYINLEIGKHTELFLSGTEIFVVSPGVEKSSLPVRYANENNIPVISELEAGYLLCKGPIIAVTGTNGKSTVVSLLGEIFRTAGVLSKVCGNIGNPLCGALKDITGKTAVILEVSSFQLERTVFFRPKISVMLNVKEDHLDRHGNFAEYLDQKRRIFKNQRERDTLILNYDDENLRLLSRDEKKGPATLYFSVWKKVEGLHLEGGWLKLFLNGKTKHLFELKDCRLKGVHNVENILAAVLAAAIFGIKKSAIEKAVKSFKPLSHRLEVVAEIGGVKFIDDSKATNIDAAKRALESIETHAILIAGGKDKNLSYGKILPVLKKKVKKVILIGETKAKMREVFKKAVSLEETDTLPEAVCHAYESASSGDCVILSPMCSSFDMFKNYRERGKVFREAVEGLKKT